MELILLDRMPRKRASPRRGPGASRRRADSVPSRRQQPFRRPAGAEARLLSTLILALSESDDLDSALNVALKEVCQLEGWSLGQTWLPNRDGTFLECGPALFAASPKGEVFHQASRQLHLLPGVDLPGRVWSAREPVWLERIEGDVNYPRATEANAAGFKAAMGIPVLAKSEVVLVLEFLLTKSGVADRRLVKTLSTVAAQLGSVIRRKRAEEALRESEERFRLAAHATKDVIWDWDIKTDLLYWGQGIKETLGYEPAELEPGIESWDHRLHSEDKEAALASLYSVVNSGGRSWSCEYRFRRADGTYAHVLDRGYLIHDEAGKPVRMIGAMLDITGRKAVEQERARLFAEVEVQRDLSRRLSHRLVEVQEEERRRIARELHDEIGQQLTALQLVLENAERQPATGLRRSLQEAKIQAGQLLAIIRDLSLELRPMLLDDLGLLPTLLWHLDRLKRLQVDFRHNGLENQRFPAEVETAAYRIVQEALTNVLRHANANEVSLRVWANHETLGVQVRDAGVGFDVNQALRAGVSSGLSGMRERAELLGGHLTIESAPGRGTTLTAELPLARPLENSTDERHHHPPR